MSGQNDLELKELEEPFIGSPLVTKIDEDMVIEERKTKYKYWLSSYAMNRINANQNYILLFVGGTGCQPAGSKVLMADGEWKNIEDVRTGDIVISPQEGGSNIYAKVSKLYMWYSDENYDISEINRGKKILTTCSHNHILPIYHRTVPRIEGIRRYDKAYWRVTYYTAKEYSELSKNYKNHKNIGMTSFEIKEFLNRKNCKMEPYTLGVFLGDGHFRSERKKRGVYKGTGNNKGKHNGMWLTRHLGITSNDPMVMEEILKYYEPRDIRGKEGTTAKTYIFRAPGKLGTQLSKLGLEGKGSGEKFIPKEALLSDSEYRKKLLAGLIDSDGYLSRYKSYSITTKSIKLAEDISSLVYSLGGRCRINKTVKGIKKTGFKGVYYRASFYIRDLELPIMLKRKRITHKNFTYLSSNRVAIDSVRAEPSIVYGFTLDSPSGCYITDNYLVTHNSGKSYSALELARDIDPYFSTDRVVFKAEDFIRMSKSGLPPGSVIIWDEVGVGMSAREWYSIQNKVVSYVLETFRRDNLILIMTTPNIGFIDKKVRALLHGFAETIDRTFTGGTYGWIKYFHIVVNLRAGTMFYRYPRIRDDFGRIRVLRGKTPTSGNVWFHKPPEHLTEPYEEKKMIFTESLKDSALKMLTEKPTDAKSLKLRIPDIITILEEDPQAYGLLDEEKLSDLVNTAFVQMTINYPESKLVKSHVDSAVKFMQKRGMVNMHNPDLTLDDKMLQTIQDLHNTESSVSKVAKAVREKKDVVERSIKDWKDRGMWSES